MTGRPKRRRSTSDPDEVERLRRENERLREKVDEQAKQIADAKKQIADLERQLALRQQNSTTTSKPPSSDGLAGQQRMRGWRKKSRRKPGGQPGHPGHSRPLVPIERVNVMVDLFPDACRHCQHALPARSRQVVGEPRRHQVTELPPIEAHITEYRCHRIVCPACGQTTQAPLPADVEGQFGPQLTALIAYLTVVCRLPTYLTYAAGRRQFCWAHFTRNLLSAQELAKTASAKHFCREALALQRQLFRVWHRFHGDPHARGAPLTRQELIAKAFPIEKK